MKIRLDLNVQSRKLQLKLIQQAILRGFKRVEPRKAWTEREEKDAIRWYFMKTLTDLVEE